MEGFEGMRMRRDPEAVAAYRRMMSERGMDHAEMSDEVVIEAIERTMEGVLNAGRAMVRAIEAMREPVLRIARAMTDIYVEAGGAKLAAETELDLQLRDELDADYRLLELFDDPDQ